MNSGGCESAWEEVWLGGIVEERAGRICGKCSWACKGVWLDRWVEQLKREQGEFVVSVVGHVRGMVGRVGGVVEDRAGRISGKCSWACKGCGWAGGWSS